MPATFEHLRAAIPAGGLFAEKSFLLSPEPLRLEPPLAEELGKLGHRLQLFQRAANELYHRSLRGKAPAWVADYLDRGKPPELLEFARQVFGADREVRLRPHFFPFTEPSVEVDVSCFRCGGSGWLPDGARCPVCKGEGWLEILGAGEVDPKVYDFVDDPRYDGEKVQGFAWGMGIDRIAMLKHGVTDLRLLFDNEVRFLEQFG
jgi:hypothetical protein